MTIEHSAVLETAALRTPMDLCGLVVGSRHDFASSPGGQQMCTQEFIETLELAGFTLSKVQFEPANGVREKLARRFNRRPYRYFVPDSLVEEVVARADETGSRFVFINTIDGVPIAPELRALRPELRIILLSHGLGSADYIHTLRVRSMGNEFNAMSKDFAKLSQAEELRMGRLIIEEARHRRYLDGVVTMSNVEVKLEHWLGARRVMMAPRTIREAAFHWAPTEGRVGFVGRLDHPPNVEGLALTLGALSEQALSGIRFRLVGAPSAEGKRIAAHYPIVDYLGVLSEEELKLEAASWCCAANPVFCYPRGATTKLAVYLGWCLPTVTTLAGTRGYEWSLGSLPTAETPAAFARLLAELALDPARRQGARAAVEDVRRTSVTREEVGKRLRRFVFDAARRDQ